MKFYNKIIYLLSIFLSPLFYFFIKIISIFKTVRIIPILTNRYGHLVINPEIYLLENQNKKKKYIDIFFSSKYGICNKVVFNLWKKKITIVPFYLIEPTYLIIIKLETNGSKHTIPYFAGRNRHTDPNFEKTSPIISLDINQKKKCEEILKQNNLDINNIKFVCIFNRDDAYHNSSKFKKDWYYLSHNNYKIKTFEDMAKKLSNRNIFVFRMGSLVEEKFEINDPKVIDYANSKFRSELMDFYLASECLFNVVCGTGSGAVSQLYRKPTIDLCANLHDHTTYFENNILLCKHYYHSIKKRNLTLKEILKFKRSETSRRDQLDKKNIEMIDCSSKEISDVTIEMLDRLEGKWKDNERLIEMQKKFKKQNWNNLYIDINGNKYYFHNKIKARYSSDFLLQNPEWLN